MEFVYNLDGKDITISCDEERLKQIKKLAIEYKIELDSYTSKISCNTIIPVREIDNIKVLVRLTKHREDNGKISLRLFIEDCFDFVDTEGDVINKTFYNHTIISRDDNTIENYIKFILVSQYLFQNLKFDDNGFVSKKRQRKHLECSIFASDNVKFIYEQCCVCMEITSQTTYCNHSLCVRCYQQIKSVKDEDDYDIYIYPCPMCRKDISRED